jgi:hypothetical protein
LRVANLRSKNFADTDAQRKTVDTFAFSALLTEDGAEIFELTEA